MTQTETSISKVAGGINKTTTQTVFISNEDIQRQIDELEATIQSEEENLVGYTIERREFINNLQAQIDEKKDLLK